MTLTKTQIAANAGKTLFQYRVKPADKSLMGKTELLIKKSTSYHRRSMQIRSNAISRFTDAGEGRRRSNIHVHRNPL